MPTAGTPWEGDRAIEDEIERALRSDAQTPVSRVPSPATRTGTKAAKTETDPTTTLGDLAERLESALAREIAAAQSAAKPVDTRPEHLDLNLDEFAFDSDAPEPTAPQPHGLAGAPSAAGRPVGTTAEQEAKRSDESPVISLNSRRREPVDPLEDEMARLLGELTGDINRR